MHRVLLILILFLSSCADFTASDLRLISIPVPNRKTSIASDFISKIENFTLPSEMAIGKVDKAVSYSSLYFFGDFDICQCVSIVDSNLNLVANIKHHGEGPGEYLNINDFTINKEKKTVDLLSINKILQYDFLGNFIRETRLPHVIYKFQHAKEDSYLIYTPKGLNNNAQDTRSAPSLYMWDLISNQINTVENPLNEIQVPHFREKNNLTFQAGHLLFSTTFLDTLYSYNNQGNLIEKYHFSSEKSLLPIKKLRIGESNSDILNDESIKEKYIYHRANLLEDDSYIVTAFIDRKLNYLLYHKKQNRSIIFSELNNDIDHGLSSIIPVLLQDRVLISINEPTAFISLFENDKIPKESTLYDFTKKLTINSPLILTKYYLK